jgi:hypothetical protein
MSSSRHVDVIIVNYRSSADTLQAVQSLMPWRFGTLWLVDNSDDPEEAGTLAQGIRQMPWARLLLPGKNLGFGRGCNLAFTESGAPYCLLLNPDALLSPRDLETLVDALGADPRLAAVSPRTFWDRDHRFLLPPAFPQSPLAEISLALASRYPRLCRMASRLYLARMQRQMASPRPVETPFLAGALLSATAGSSTDRREACSTRTTSCSTRTLTLPGVCDRPATGWRWSPPPRRCTHIATSH